MKICSMEQQADLAESDMVNTVLSKQLASPDEVRRSIALSSDEHEIIADHRRQVVDILDGRDDRLLVIAGPCSIHDPEAAVDYAARLKFLSDRVKDRMLIVMRCYVEKPRTTVGWKGLLYDPDLNGSHDISKGVYLCRKLMRDIVQIYQLPLATEALSTLAMHYISDLLSWVAVGARTTESQLHRELISGLSVPAGFKNATNGGLEIALNAMKSASAPHSFLGVDASGRLSALHTQGNCNAHMVLRGGKSASGKSMPNYDDLSLARCEQAHETAGMPAKVLVDCSHENSAKQHKKQVEVARSVVNSRQQGRQSVRGLMLESYIEGGAQNLTSSGSPASLTYGQSITDACLGWRDTEALLMGLYETLE